MACPFHAGVCSPFKELIEGKGSASGKCRPNERMNQGEISQYLTGPQLVTYTGGDENHEDQARFRKLKQIRRPSEAAA